jgi:hypothetical protein
MSNLIVVRAEFSLVKREEGETTCEALARQATHLSIDLLFVGSFGRKRDTLDAVHVGVLGTVADQSLRTSAADICMVKSTSYAVEQTSTFLVPVDLSARSGYAFMTTVRHLARPNDTIHVVTYQSRHRAEPSEMPGEEAPGQAHVVTLEDMAPYEDVRTIQLTKTKIVQIELQTLQPCNGCHAVNNNARRVAGHIAARHLCNGMLATMQNCIHLQALKQWGGKHKVEIIELAPGQSIAHAILERARKTEVRIVLSQALTQQKCCIVCGCWYLAMREVCPSLFCT